MGKRGPKPLPPHPHWTDADGNGYIKLNGGIVVTVDAVDLTRVLQYHWRFDGGYVKRTCRAW